MQSKSRISFILSVQIAFPILNTSVVPDDCYRHGSISVEGMHATPLYLLLVPLVLAWDIAQPLTTLHWAKSPSSVLRASRNKPGEFCQLTAAESLSLL